MFLIVVITQNIFVLLPLFIVNKVSNLQSYIHRQSSTRNQLAKVYQFLSLSPVNSLTFFLCYPLQCLYFSLSLAVVAVANATTIVM